MAEQAEQVYQFIWNYLTQFEELPSQQQIAYRLGFSRGEVSRAVALLRQDQKIEPRILMPTAYRAWWRDNLAARWASPA